MNDEKNINVDNIKIQMRKGTLDFSILLIISKGKAYASTIIESLKWADLIIVEGTLYPLLNRLKRNGILDYEWEESKSGPPRKYYSLTKKGEEVLISLIDSWSDLNKSITKLIKNYEKSN
jgi:PadR family transcriptional regulator PadR